MSISAETHTIEHLSDAYGGSLLPRKRRVTRPKVRTRDEDLVLQAQQGDATAYSQLYERYHPYIRKILSDDVSDVEARNDILQSVFERGWSKITMLRDPKAFKAWIAQLARRLVIDHYRSSSRSVPTDFTDPDEMFELAADDWSAHDWAAMHELASALQIGINGLSSRDATVLELATSFGFTSQEIAAALDIDVSHARVLLHRARRRLSKELVASYQDPSE